MNTIVWTLSIVVMGWQASPERVEITFPTEQACEAAKVTVKARVYSVSCEPRRATS